MAKVGPEGKVDLARPLPSETPDEWPREWNGSCPLCGSEPAGGHPLFTLDRYRPYYRCPRCALIHVPPPWQLTREAEKARYDTHVNDPEDDGYRKWLERIIPPLEQASPVAPGPARAGEAPKGLDYGCGPGPALVLMLEERGWDMAAYDPFYHNRKEVLVPGSYDLVTCTEVIEHMAFPKGELDRLEGLLKPRGVLALMTQLVTKETDFDKWYYKDDETHICYFSRPVFEWVARDRGWDVSFHGRDVIIFTLPAMERD